MLGLKLPMITLCKMNELDWETIKRSYKLVQAIRKEMQNVETSICYVSLKDP